MCYGRTRRRIARISIVFSRHARRLATEVLGLALCLALTLTPQADARTPTAPADRDGDGLSDRFEWAHGLDPASRDSDDDGIRDPSEDEDGDNLSVLGEQLAGTSPLLRDTDEDGVEDGREDPDGDGIDARHAQDRGPVPKGLTPSLRAAAQETSDAKPAGCQADPHGTAMPRCHLGDPAASTIVVLFGDSHGTQWLPAFDRAGKADGFHVVTLLRSGCPPPQVDAFESTVWAQCPPWRDAAIDWLNAHPPDLIVLAAAPRYHLFRPAEPQREELFGAAAAAAWSEAYAETLALLPRGVRVVLLGEIVRPRVDVPECLLAHRRMSACTTRRARGTKPGWAAGEQAVAATAGIRWATLAGVVCPYDPCPVVSDRMLVWRDNSHLTRTFARSAWRAVARIVADGLAAPPPP